MLNRTQAKFFLTPQKGLVKITSRSLEPETDPPYLDLGNVHVVQGNL